MFFYLHCDWGFICLHRRRAKRCLITWFLCGNPQNSFGRYKAPCHTWHIWTTLFMSPLAEHVTLLFHGIAARPVLIVMCVQSSDVSIWFWDSKWARFTWETSRCIEENCSATTGVEQQNLNWENLELLQSTCWKCFLSLSKNHYPDACQ